MSVKVMAWVWEFSRSEPVDRLVLLAIADCANDQGAEAYPSTATLAQKTALHPRSVQRCLKRLIELGELQIQDRDGPHYTNRYRIIMGYPTPGTPPPPTPGTVPPRHSATPADSQGTPGTAPPIPPAQRHLNHPGTIPEPSVEPSSSPASAVDLPERPDVEELCKHLADRIEHNGSKRPTITKAWRDAARLMLDNDNRTLEQVHRAIAWCQSDEFWRTNILSMPTLRKQYDRLRLAATRGNGSGPARQSTTDLRVSEGLRLAEALERQELPA